MKKLVALFVAWYAKKYRLWLPVAIGLLYACAFPPFNHEMHPLLAFFPFSGFLILVPLFCFSVQKSVKKAFIDSYIFSIAASFSQYYWVAGVAAEGMRHIIISASLAMSFFLACYMLSAAMFFRYTIKYFKRLYVFLFPAIWILIEFVRGWGELSFPWNYLGYIFVPLLPIAQLSSICGVFGLSFIVVVGNILVWEILRGYYLRKDIVQKWIHLAVFSVLCSVAAIWGVQRMANPLPEADSVRVSILQSNMDQAHWGDGSLDTCLDITEKLAYQAAVEHSDLIVLAESAIFCYLVRQPYAYNRILEWSDSVKIPIITGSLHWERFREHRPDEQDYAVYNTAFFIDTGSGSFERYYKIHLLPFSEVLPFEAQIPLLNRVNLGEADFTPGSEEKLFKVGPAIRAAPFICLEIIFPQFVRRRMSAGANLLVNITNDGWFGRSNGPYQHAAMARMRSIENGVALVRCANSGISIVVDQYGRVLGKTKLYERTVLTRTVSLSIIPTLYVSYGDWPLWAALILTAGAMIFLALSRLLILRKI